MSKVDQKKRHRQSSDSDSDNDQLHSKKMYADGYDDKYRGNADDRTWLKNLSEREREAELLKRYEQREALKHREEITKKLRSKVKDDDNSDNETKTKTNSYDNNIYAAEDDDDDDHPASSKDRKSVNALKQKETQHSKSLQSLLEERKKQQEKSLKLNDKEKWEVDKVYSESDSDEESDDDDDQQTRRNKESEEKESKRKKCTSITTKSQLKSMVISRFRMEKWCHAPFFASVVKGAFVRINIGQNKGVPIYRVCEVCDVVETGKVYNLGSTRTNKGLRLKHGGNERVFRLEYVSNSEISDSEFKRWREAAIKQNTRLPTLEDLENKIKAIDKCKHYVFNNREITKMIDEKSRFRKAPINYAMTKNELLKEIDIAKDENDKKRESDLRKKLSEIEERASELDRKRSENISVIAQINQRNRKKTQQNVEKALVREAQEHRNSAPDPFTRRPCAPMLGTKAVPTKEELIRALQLQRANEEAEAKKKLEEQRLLAEKANAKNTITTITEITTDKHIFSNQSLSTMTIHERGSFTSLSTNNDDLFTSHDFELDFAI